MTHEVSEELNIDNCLDSMTEPQHRTLQIDTTVELKDYFHVYFDSTKVQLIIGVIVVLIFFGGISYFFFLIGEAQILVQLLPLFLGLPLVAIVGQLLRVHASYRKYIKKLSDNEKQIHYIFSEGGDGFEIVRGASFGHFGWADVRRIRERPGYLNIVLNDYQSVIIPKRFLRSDAEQQLMREIIAAAPVSDRKLLE